MIKPTVGRIVWYNPHPDEPIYSATQVLAAIVTAVHDDTRINVAVFDAAGRLTHSRINVEIIQDAADADAAPPPGCCGWMPYQKGQAAKTEALEKQAAATG